MTTTIRRLALLALVGAAVAWVLAARRRTAPPTGPDTAVWPPFPEADADAADVWVAPDADGSCPLDHPVKANDNSGIFHVPGGRFYERTKAERCYARAEDAESDGYRAAKA